MPEESIGARVRRLREERGWMQAAFARELGMTKQQLNALEHSDQQRMHPESLRRYARVLEVSEIYLLTGAEAPAPEAPDPGTMAAALRSTSALTEEQIAQVMRIVRQLEAEQEAHRKQREMKPPDR